MVENNTEKCLHLFEEGKHQDAIDCLDQFLSKDPKNKEALYLKGTCYFEINEYNLAIKFFDKALMIDSDYINPLNDKGVVLLKLEDYKEADKYFSRVLNLKPDLAAGNFNKGLALYNLEKYDDAFKYFEKSSNLDMEYAEAFYFKGVCQEHFDNYDEALKSYNQALKLQPDEPDYLNAKGELLSYFKEYNNAIEYFNKALKIDENHVIVLFNKGDTLYQLNKSEQSLECFKKVIKLDPEYAEAWNYLGFLYDIKGDKKEALKCYDKAVEVFPDFELALLNKGITLRELKKPKEALECVENVIKTSPEYADAWYHKGNILRDLNKEEESIKAYETFVKLVEKNSVDNWKLTARRIKEFIRMTKEGEEVSVSPPEEPQFWQWVTKSEYFLESDGKEREALDPAGNSDPGDYWTCHKNTRIGDLIMLYRAGKKDGVTYQDIKYLIQAQSDAYTIDYEEYAFEHGWQYGCDFKPLYKFDNSLKYHDLLEDPYLEDWNALRKRFQGIAFKTDERHWKRLQELLSQKNPGYKEFIKTFKPKEVIETDISEKLVEDKLSKNLNVLKKFGYDLKFKGRQVRCTGQGGRIDLLCEDNNDSSLVILELKIVKATRNTFGQISNYIGWAIKRKANGRNVKGIVISKGYDNEFDSAQLTNKDVNYLDLADVLDELGLKIKY